MIAVLGDRVLVAVRKAPEEVTTDSGLVLVKDPDAAKTPTQGIVMALGDKTGSVSIDDVRDVVRELRTQPEWPARDDAQLCCEAGPLTVRLAELEAVLGALTPAAFDVAVGDCVVFPLSAGDEIHADGVDYVILREADIIGIVSPLVSEAA
jgi:co-chaperonin GroES (HSP10)